MESCAFIGVSLSIGGAGPSPVAGLRDNFFFEGVKDTLQNRTNDRQERLHFAGDRIELLFLVDDQLCFPNRRAQGAGTGMRQNRWRCPLITCRRLCRIHVARSCRCTL